MLEHVEELVGRTIVDVKMSYGDPEIHLDDGTVIEFIMERDSYFSKVRHVKDPRGSHVEETVLYYKPE